ncbi:7257_t:CDS:2, partial [Gigaspora rosea]
PEADVVSSGPSKKQWIKNLDSVMRLETYKSVNFEAIMIKDLLHPFKPSRIPELVKDYLYKNRSQIKQGAADRALVHGFEIKKLKSTSGLTAGLCPAAVLTHCISFRWNVFLLPDLTG